MNLFKKLSYILVAISGIWALTFALNVKQDSKAAEFPADVAIENNANVSRGGGLADYLKGDLKALIQNGFLKETKHNQGDPMTSILVIGNGVSFSSSKIIEEKIHLQFNRGDLYE
ncbi:hypothetical protein [Xylocopilactobacillus apicola]|uniref:Uncharacterized protein n=1 Tax=Xylocopilactobacillus apicola TaxID=2932184 RepID=A0AAU9DUU7_9LACO|nr:hypothetical protein [Xylocopilactobacillus apicola]BDR59288.1 hypothetical protein XA3_17290 [Xylocopilactobacillus apicola]